MGSLSFTHLLLLVLILLLFFGPSKLPQLGQSIGKAIRGFKEGLNEIDAESRDISDNKNQTQINHQTQNQNQSEPVKPQKDEIKKS
jgi:sec-independent protein translocase protein TatA